MVATWKKRKKRCKTPIGEQPKEELQKMDEQRAVELERRDWKKQRPLELFCTHGWEYSILFRHGWENIRCRVGGKGKALA